MGILFGQHYLSVIQDITPMKRSIINLSIPKELDDQIIFMAKEESKSKSELRKEVFRVYQFRKKWAKIRAIGEGTARRMGIESYEDIEKIAG